MVRKKFGVTKKTEIERESKLWQLEREWKQMSPKEREINIEM